MNTPAHDDAEAGSEPGPGFSPGPGFMPPPPAERLAERPAAAQLRATATATREGKRVKRWHLASNGTRGVSIFLALGALFVLREPGGFFTDLVAAAILAAPLVYLLATSKPAS